jgi:predicted  nucleic acid-binding Zn ribbon protein
MTKDELKALIEDLRLNHEYCPKEVILQAADELERLQTAEQEPVAWRYGALLYHDKLDAMEFIRTSGDSYLLEPLYTQPQRTWVGLTDEEVTWLCNTAKSHEQTWGMFVRAIETKLRSKNDSHR